MMKFFGRLRLGFQREKLRVTDEVKPHRPHPYPAIEGLIGPTEIQRHELTLPAYLQAIKTKYRLLTKDTDQLNLE